MERESLEDFEQGTKSAEFLTPIRAGPVIFGRKVQQFRSSQHIEPKIEVSAETRLSEADPPSDITLSIIDGTSAVKLSPAEVRELARQLWMPSRLPEL